MASATLFSFYIEKIKDREDNLSLKDIDGNSTVQY